MAASDLECAANFHRHLCVSDATTGGKSTPFDPSTATDEWLTTREMCDLNDVTRRRMVVTAWATMLPSKPANCIRPPATGEFINGAAP
jgi:hypothetical protein